MRISSSSVFFNSLDAFLNSARLLPSDRPSSGSFRGPKMISAITKMMISSGMPIEPNIALLLSDTGGKVRSSEGSRHGLPEHISRKQRVIGLWNPGLTGSSDSQGIPGPEVIGDKEFVCYAGRHATHAPCLHRAVRNRGVGSRRRAVRAQCPRSRRSADRTVRHVLGRAQRD